MPADVIDRANAVLLRELDRALERLEGATAPADRARAALDVASVAASLADAYVALAGRGRHG